MSQLFHKDWDINENRNTGHFKDGKPIIEAIIQNGLNDIEPDGSFVPCDMGVESFVGNVSTLRGKRGRWGKLHFTDSDSINQHRCKITYKNGNGRSIKYTGGDSGPPEVANGKPIFTSNDGISIEHTPTYKGVRIELVINDPLTAPLEYPFSLKDYGQVYTDEIVDGAIISTGEDGKKITFHAPYAVDANGDIGQAHYVLTGTVGNYQTFKKVVDDEAWLRNAVAPVRIDPNVTIDDVSGTFEDSTMQANNSDNNWGGFTAMLALDGSLGSFWSFLCRVDLSAYSDITITLAKYIFDTILVAGTPVSFDMTINPSLRQWNEGNKTGATASTGEVTADSARHNEQLWTIRGGNGVDTDHDSSISDTFATPTVLGIVDAPLSIESVQSKIDAPSTNYGDIFRSPEGVAGTLIRVASSENTTDTKPALYFEFTEGAAFNPSWARNSNQIIGVSQ